MAAAWLNAFVFTSIWAAAAAGLLCMAASVSMGLGPSCLAASLASAGTLVIYNLDHLRDLERDRSTTPTRSAFIRKHRSGVYVVTLMAGLAALVLVSLAGPRVFVWLIPAGILGVLHRRLKRLPYAKPVYVTMAWVSVVAGLPLSMGAGSVHTLWVVLVLSLSILANVIASNVRDKETAAAVTPRMALGFARGVAACGFAVALFAPDLVRPLGAVPLATLLSLFRTELSEWYGLVVVDGALVVGALVALGMH
ncbi:hypothetical protein MK489_06015 [Myxococcota bacterium]|nr:hypothetical protein [Myxococcota bacterium]